ncbi:MAG: class D sortase [Anaerotruncus sp.]|nr:class D sortase [Anaerotruncus sp.]
MEIQTDDEEEICGKLSPALEYNEGGFTGTLALDEDSVTTQATESEGYAYTVRDVRQLFGVNRNDPYYLPQTVRKHGAMLKLTNVDWSPMGERYDVNSIPDLYNAVATYTGKAYGSKPTAFAVSATYTGEVSRMVPGNLQYTLLYEPAEPLLSEEQLAEDAAKAKRVALSADMAVNKAYTVEDGLIVIQPEKQPDVSTTRSDTAAYPSEQVWEKDTVSTYNHFTLPEKAALSNGSLGLLHIPKLALSVDVFETDDQMEDMRHGVAHFKPTSAWQGNIGISGHNFNFDLTDGYFKNLFLLKEGDEISYTTQLGSRTYLVETVAEISDEDWSYLERTEDNRLTLITCISGKPEKRLCVQAMEKK